MAEGVDFHFRKHIRHKYKQKDLPSKVNQMADLIE